MKQASYDKSRKSGHQSDDDNVRYKLNTEFFNSTSRAPNKVAKTQNVAVHDDDTVRYKFPKLPVKSKIEKKAKPKPKIKVNFWSNKQSLRLNKPKISKQNNRRHTFGETEPTSKAKNPVKLRKQVSLLPSPIFSENHIPMVTVPDDLTIQLNEEEANDLREDLDLTFDISESEQKFNDNLKQNTSSVQKTTTVQSGPRKSKRSLADTDSRSQGNEFELEFFSKYVVQKLRRMETNQRIYSENLINTVLMLGQLGKLNGKSKISEP